MSIDLGLAVDLGLNLLSGVSKIVTSIIQSNTLSEEQKRAALSTLFNNIHTIEADVRSVKFKVLPGDDGLLP